MSTKTDPGMADATPAALAAVEGGTQIDLTAYRICAEYALAKLDLAGRAELAMAKDLVRGPIPRDLW
jgi:hypothetical protein